MSCKYCSNDFYDFELGVGTCDTSSCTFIDTRGGKVFLSLTTSGYDNHEMDSIEINYCPWCGAELIAER